MNRSCVKWLVLIRVAVLIAVMAVVMLGVVAVTAGPTAASGLAEVIAGLCELTAAMPAVIGWAGRRRAATATGKDGAGAPLSLDGRPAPGRVPASDRGVGKYAVNLGDNPQGLAAWKIDPTPQSRYALVSAATSPAIAVLTHAGPVNAPAFGSDGRTLATGSAQGIRLWDVSAIDQALTRLRGQIGGFITHAEWRQYVPTGPAYRRVCP